MLPCCLLLIWWKFFINEPDKIHHRSRVTRDSTSWDKQACIHDALWRQHYITTSKEYLTNSHILSIYFELAFLQLHLVKISCKLIIIWVNYERNKKGARFFETQCSIVTLPTRDGDLLVRITKHVISASMSVLDIRLISVVSSLSKITTYNGAMQIYYPIVSGSLDIQGDFGGVRTFFAPVITPPFTVWGGGAHRRSFITSAIVALVVIIEQRCRLRLPFVRWTATDLLK